MYDSLELIDADQIAEYMKSLQNEDGSFSGDKWGETDLRFAYCALSCLKILGKLDCVDVSACVNYIT